MKSSVYSIVLIFSLASTLIACYDSPQAKSNMAQNPSKSIYDYSFRSLHDGKEIKFSEFKGKKMLIVNTASECGYTPHYEQLQEISVRYTDKLVVIGFPANDFGAQEPGSNEEIETFCKKNYGVTFPMSQKITVKGDDMHPIYQWLTRKELNGKLDSEVKWNFQKYLVDEEGNFVAMFPHKTKPDAPEIIRAIEE